MLFLALVSYPATSVESASDVNALTGFWEGTAVSVAYLNGAHFPVLISIWSEAGEAKSILATPFFVSRIDTFKFELNLLSLQFSTPLLGEGFVEGRVEGKEWIDFTWGVGEAVRGTAEFTSRRSPTADRSEGHQIEGTYSGIATGPLVAEPFEISLELKSESEGVTGQVVLPFGAVPIHKSEFTNEGFRIECGVDGQDGLILGTVTDDVLEIFWQVAPGTGQALLKKQ